MAWMTWIKRHRSLVHVLGVAPVVGVLAGFGAVVFRAMIGFVHNLLFLGVASYHYDAGQHTPLSPLGPWIILVPTAAALVVALLVRDFAHEARGAGVAEVIDAVYYKRGVIRPVVALVKTLAASLSLGSGGSVGREGPIIQIGASLGSSLGQLMRMTTWQRTTLLAAGAGSGIAATFNAPAAGVLFAMEMVLPEISVRTLVPVIVATATATLLGRAWLGAGPVFPVPMVSAAAAFGSGFGLLVVYAVLGVGLGVAATLFIRSVYLFQGWFNRLPGNDYTRHALGMLLVGVILYVLADRYGHYYVQGLSYAAVHDVLTHGMMGVKLLLLLLVLKLLATALTLGSGASGGIFSPALFLGAVLGVLYAKLAALVLPAALQPGTTEAALVAMGGMVAGATGAVLTAVVMVVELTGQSGAMVPLLIVSALALVVRRMFMDDNMYSMKLAERGHFVPDALYSNSYMVRGLGRLLHMPHMVVDLDREPAATAPHLRAPVHVLLTRGGRLEGVVPAAVVAHLARSGTVAVDWLTAAERNYLLADVEECVAELLARMRQDGVDIAVVTADGRLDSIDRVLGVVTREQLMHGGPLPRRLRSAASTPGHQ